MNKEHRGNRRNKRLLMSVGLAVSLFFLILAFQGLQPESFIANLKGVQIDVLLAAALIYFAAVTVISLRWQFLLRSIRLLPLPYLTGLVSIAYMGNNVYPLRAGEALRIYLLRRDHKIPFTKSTTTVLIERMFDGLVMLSFILVGLPVLNVQSQEIRTVATFAAPIFLTAFFVFLLLAAKPELLRRLERLVVAILPGKLGDMVENLAEEVIQGLEGLRSPFYLVGAVAASFVTWGIEAFVYWLVMFAFGIEVGYPVALLVVGTVNLAGILPTSAGQFGVYEFVVGVAMVSVGIPKDLATAYAVVVHIVIWLPVTLVGFALLVRRGMGLSDIATVQTIETENLPEPASHESASHRSEPTRFDAEPAGQPN